MTNQILFTQICKFATYGAVFKGMGSVSSKYQDLEIAGPTAKVNAMAFDGSGTFIFGLSLYFLKAKLSGNASTHFNFIYWSGLISSSIGGAMAHDHKLAQSKGIKALYVMGEVISFAAVSGVFVSMVVATDPKEKLLCRSSAIRQVPYLALKGYESLPGNRVAGPNGGGVAPSNAPSPLVKLDPTEEEAHYLGREDTIEQVLAVLSAEGGSNNVMLRGPAGTGKTQFVNSLAYRINRNEIPGFEGYTVYSASGTDLMGGTHWRGLLEKKIKAVGDFLKSQEKAIVFIDEIHQLVADPRHDGHSGFDISGMLLPYLTHRKVRVIGATTPDEGEILNNNMPFKQRFNPISMPEMTPELRLQVLTDLIRIETVNGKTFPDGFAQRIREFNQEHGRRSPREDKAFFKLIVSKMVRQNITAAVAFEQIVQSGIMTRNAESMPQFLTELTANLDEVSYEGRELEIERILDTLFSDQEANNVILHAPAGSGKTEMMRFIASRIRDGELVGFENFKVYSTSAIELVADQRAQGDLEKKVQKLFAFLEGEGDVILFIDEIHQLIGRGGIDGMLLTKLLNPRIRMVGATTPEQGVALALNCPFLQRFTMMELAPMSPELRQQILQGCIGKYEDLEFPEGFAQKLIAFNDGKVKSSVREDKQLLGMIASRMKRHQATAQQAYQFMTREAYA